MSDFFGKLKSGAGKVAFEAEKMNRLNKARGELEKLKSQVQAQYAKLGEMYFTQHETTGVTGPAYDEICQAIKDLQVQVENKNEDLQNINAEVYTPQGAQPAAQPVATPMQATPVQQQSVPPAAAAPAVAAKKFCTNCGTEIPGETKFCPNCGTKVS
jgi:zinc-ribbon domain